MRVLQIVVLAFCGFTLTPSHGDLRFGLRGGSRPRFFTIITSGLSSLQLVADLVDPFPLFPQPVDGAVYKFDSWLGDEGAVVRVLDRRRFPPPWTVDEQRLCFVVRDRTGQAVARLYFEDDSSGRSAGKLLSRDKARWIAVRIMKLPELLRRS
jgi:hypothetical protein